MDLQPISIDFLYEGLLVDYPIYYKEGKNLVLLCKDIILTKTKLEALKNMLDAGRNIYVDEQHHSSLLEDTRYFKHAQKVLEERLGIDKIKESVKEFIGNAVGGGVVKREEIEELACTMDMKLEGNDSATIIQCVSGMRDVDEYLFTHSVNVALLNGLIGKWMHLRGTDRQRLVKAGAVHDIGKIRVSPKILNKPGRLTPLEFEAVKMHPLFGRQILVDSGEDDKEILDVAVMHHEKVNGTGYPYGLKGAEISQYAKITAVSDIYDAMVARRTYKEECSPFEILDQISKDAFSGLDLNIIKIFLQNMPTELSGTNVLLSNGATAKVLFVSPNNYKYPMVELDGEVFQTSERLRCVRIYK